MGTHNIDSSVDKTKQTSPLLKLPAELRNRIYHETLADSNQPNTFHLSKESMEPPLLTTSHQIRTEASGIFYANTILQFNDPTVCVRRLATLSSKFVELIPELRYDTSEPCTVATSWRTAFRELPGLDEDTKLENLRDELARRGIRLRAGVLKARIFIAERPSWTADPLAACLDAVKLGDLVGRMMFVGFSTFPMSSPTTLGPRYSTNQFVKITPKLRPPLQLAVAE
ncbi:hypothetical protein AC579_1875 [Pseudocercospora musae]|uniref:Uncharacterized protein n=1 Tax=Pseudocercospora musae TaxID=113226 RepID=A0A139IBY4_9PEZI|nr:hypothetical protein AC579_1875 [Pseudocercospora musae]